MSTLATALAIGDTQVHLDTALVGVGPAGFAVKIDSELLQVGGIDYRLGTTLALKYPATAAHAANATVTPVLDAFTEDATSPFASGGGGLSGSPETYTESNVTTDRAFNANSMTLDEIADVLGSLIVDLRARGVVA